jgi:hypothetical protein
MHSSGLRLKAVTSPVDVNEFTFSQGMQRLEAEPGTTRAEGRKCVYFIKIANLITAMHTDFHLLKMRHFTSS